MNLNINVNSPKVNYEPPKTAERNKTNPEQSTKGAPISSQASRVDTYTPSEKVEQITYEKPTVKPDTVTVDRLKAEAELRYQELRNLVKQLVEEQGYTLAEITSGSATLEVDEATQLGAQAAISEGGEHSVEAVSDRLVEFAIAISGGDKSKLDTLKGAIEDGFRAAEDVWGGTLPDISYQTLEATMEKLDKWAQEAE